MKPRLQNTTANEARIFKMVNDVDTLKINTERQLDGKFAEIEGVLTETKDTIKEAKEAINDTKSKLKEIDSNFESLSNEVVEVIKEIKETGLKGDKGDDADEDAIEERLLAKIPKIEQIVKELPTKDEIVKEVIKQIPENKPSLKVIQESIDIDLVVEKLEEKNKDKLIEIEKVNGLTGKLDNITRDIARKTGYSGGGDTVKAGTNVTITTDSNGNKVINSTGGGSGGLTQVYTAISSATAAGSTAATWYTYDSTGTVTLTLPTAVGNTSLYSCRCVSGVLTVATTGGQTINGSTAEIYPLAALTIQSNGSNWIII